MAEYFRVKEAFAYGNFVASPGEIWAGDHPDYKGREQFFEPVASAAVRATETASAAPGELRSVAKKAPAKKAAPKPEPKKTDDEPKGEN